MCNKKRNILLLCTLNGLRSWVCWVEVYPAGLGIIRHSRRIGDQSGAGLPPWNFNKTENIMASIMDEGAQIPDLLAARKTDYTFYSYGQGNC